MRWMFFLGTNGTKICGPAKDKCCKAAQDDAFRLNIQYASCSCLPSCNELRYNVYASEADFDLKKTPPKLIYLPLEDYATEKYSVLLLFSCIFSIHSIHWSFTFSAIFSSVRISFEDESFSVIKVIFRQFFVNSKFLHNFFHFLFTFFTKRTDRSSLLDFISSSGALAGLFLGASLLSIVEVIYFFTLRIFLARRTNRRIADFRAAFSRSEPGFQPAPQPEINQTMLFKYLPWMFVPHEFKWAKLCCEGWEIISTKP